MAQQQIEQPYSIISPQAYTQKLWTISKKNNEKIYYLKDVVIVGSSKRFVWTGQSEEAILYWSEVDVNNMIKKLNLKHCFPICIQIQQ